MTSIRDTLRNPWVKLIGLLLIIGVLAWAVYVLRDVFVPFALALIVAYILDPVVDILERRKIPRTLAIVMLTTGLVIAVAGGTLLVVLDIQAALSEKADRKAPVQEEPSARTDEEAASEADTDQSGDARFASSEEKQTPGESTDESGSSARPAVESEAEEEKQEEQTAEAWAASELKKLLDRLPERFRPLAEEAAYTLYRYLAPRLHSIAGAFVSAVMGAASSAWSFVAWTFKFALFVVVTLYLLIDIDRLREKTVKLLPPRYKPDVVRIARKIDADLRSFFRGQLLVAATLTAFYLIGLLIAGVPYALPIAIIGGIGNFIPYLGTLLGVFSGLIASVASYGVDLHILYVIVVFVIGQVLEGNVITPKIVGRSVGLSPVAIIFSIMVFGKLLGFFGVLFAVPLASTVRVFAGELLPRIGLKEEATAQAEPPGKEPDEEPPDT